MTESIFHPSKFHFYICEMLPLNCNIMCYSLQIGSLTDRAGCLLPSIACYTDPHVNGQIQRIGNKGEKNRPVSCESASVNLLPPLSKATFDDPQLDQLANEEFHVSPGWEKPKTDTALPRLKLPSEDDNRMKALNWEDFREYCSNVSTSEVNIMDRIHGAFGVFIVIVFSFPLPERVATLPSWRRTWRFTMLLS
jgi:hypothetical protein